jgi:ACS family hexuronate transporter-like MFS transporter
MPDSSLPARPVLRSPSWRWWVCGLLLLATSINYMDRLTLNLLKVPILADLRLDDRHYGHVEACFGLAFACGAVLFGFIVDRWNVFWVYPLALVGWCAAGFLTGFAQGFWSLLACRMMLGLFEAANWPCALRTTQHLLPPGERSMGNSILQSGAAVGALLVPQLLNQLYSEDHPHLWRLPFQVVGVAGLGWVLLWLLVLRPRDLRLHAGPAPGPGAGYGPPAQAPLPAGLFWRRFVVLVVLVVTINMTWHFLRAWLPSYLMTQLRFTQTQTNRFMTAYYVFTDGGALAAGFLSLYLTRRGLSVHASRRLVFLGGALLVTLAVWVPFAGTTAALVGLLLLVGFGSLGMFPCYYSFSQDLTVRGQGRLTGALGACCWGTMFLWHEAIGQWVYYTGSYVLPFVLSGVLPLGAFAVLVLLWAPGREHQGEEPAAKTNAPGENEPGEAPTLPVGAVALKG